MALNSKTQKQPHIDQMKDNQMEGRPPNQRKVSGDSVDEHSYIEAGNILLTGDEIKQQNENL